MPTYYSYVTDIGASKILDAQASGTHVSWTHMAVGDGGGSATTPSVSQTALVHEVYRETINNLEVDPNHSNQMIAEFIVPEDVGGWTIREVGVFDDDGDLVAVANYPATFKPILTDGTAREELIQLIISVSNTSPVDLIIDPSAVSATRQWVSDNFTQVVTTVHLGGDATGAVTLDDTSVNLNVVLVALNILNKLKTVDGVGSGLDADLLQGKPPSVVPTGNTIAVRNGDGKIEAGLIGNADTATTADKAYKWVNGRTLTVGKDATGSVFIDGTQNITLNIDLVALNLLNTLKTVDGTTSGLDADLLDGYQASASNEPSTIPVRNLIGKITADLSGNADTATNADKVDGWHASASRVASTIPVRNADEAILADLLGNATTATTADKANKWTNGRTVTLAGDLTGSVFLDGTEDKTLTATFVATELLNKLKTVDGTTSGLDADLVDGWHASASRIASTIPVRNANEAILADLLGNATTAEKWLTARTLALTGAVAGSASIDGSGNVSLATSFGGGTFTGFPSTNGYQKFPSGIIIQAGRSGSINASVNVTFPIAFPTAVMAIILTPRYTAGGVINPDDMCYVSADSLTGFTISRRFDGDSTAWPNVYWYAVGY